MNNRNVILSMSLLREYYNYLLVYIINIYKCENVCKQFAFSNTIQKSKQIKIKQTPFILFY